MYLLTGGHQFWVGSFLETIIAMARQHLPISLDQPRPLHCPLLLPLIDLQILIRFGWKGEKKLCFKIKSIRKVS